MAKMRSYTSRSNSALSFLREVTSLYEYSRQASERARHSIEDMRNREAIITEKLGLTLSNLDLLEIGPGQYQAQSKYLAIKNRVVGIDLDLISDQMTPVAYVKMLRTNGLHRTAKTLGRKILGIDREFARELKEQLGVDQLPTLQMIQMDACRMSFPDDSFDFVYARSVFHHLPDPAAALDGIVRILRPGASTYIVLHLYTSNTGCLDPRIFTDRRSELGAWPHLRPALVSTLNNANTYLNKLRLNQWRELFATKMPGGELLTVTADSKTVDMAESLKSKGELGDYSLEELITNELNYLWRKPLGRTSGMPGIVGCSAGVPEPVRYPLVQEKN